MTSLSETISNVPLAGLHHWAGHTHQGIPWDVHRGDSRLVLRAQEADSFACVVTSPPYYWQRDYKVDGQIGLELTIAEYVEAISDTMDEVMRVLAPDGLLFLNLGDTYYSAKGQPKGNDRKNEARRFGLRAVDTGGLGVPRKTTIGIPWRVALEMISRGWTLRSPIIWRREGSLPEPTAKDRPWRSYEMVFMFSKRPRYYFDRSALDGEEDVWTISERAKASGLDTAAFPEQLVAKCLSVGCKPGGRVLDPFVGSGTVIRVATRMSHPALGIDLSERSCEYIAHSLGTL